MLPEMARALYNLAVVAAKHQILDGRSHEDGPAAAVKLAVVCGLRRPQQDSIARERSGAHRATDTLSVAWLAGTFGHCAQASPASSLNHMNCLEHVYTKVGP